MNTLFDIGSSSSAVLSKCGNYRYSLIRQWDAEKPRVLFVMLNPSTADAQLDDSTIRRCIGYAKAWGAGSLEVVNLFAFRATNPECLLKVVDPIGSENDAHIQAAKQRASMVVVAWGCLCAFSERRIEVLKLLTEDSKQVFCLGTTKDGFPRHPLYCKADLQPVLYEEDTAK